MPRFFLVAAVIGLGLFNIAQYHGWSLFSEDANPQAVRNLNAARAFHK